MKCAYCGKKNKDGALFCKRCGIGLPGPAPKDVPKPEGAEKAEPSAPAPSVPDETFDWTVTSETKAAKKNGKKGRSLLIILALFAVIAIAALAIWFFALSRGEILPAGSSSTLLDGAAVYRGEFIVPGEGSIAQGATSLDGSTVGLLTHAGELYAVVRGEQKLVASFVSRFACSADGSRMVYVDDNGLLWSYETKGKDAPVCICSEPADGEFALSPDGKTVLFNKQGDDALWLWNGKKLTRSASGQKPISVSNGGRYIYGYSGSDNALYYTDRRGRTTFLRDSTNGFFVYLNSLHNEIVFATDAGDGKIITLICRNGGEPAVIMNAGEAVHPVSTVSGVQMREQISGHTVVTCPLKSFENRLFCGAGLAVLTRSGASVLEDSPCGPAFATDNYSSVYYIMNGSLMKRNVNRDDEAEKLCDAVDFRMSANGSRIWYESANGALWCRKGRTEEPITKETTGFCVRPNTGAAIFITRGCANRNNDGRTLNSYCFDDVVPLSLAADAYGVYAKTETGWVNLTKGGSKVGWFD